MSKKFIFGKNGKSRMVESKKTNKKVTKTDKTFDSTMIPLALQRFHFLQLRELKLFPAFRRRLYGRKFHSARYSILAIGVKFVET